MDQVFSAHPVPQNVTNFEFHLVGDMTLKQFGYLAAGLGLAYVLFVVMAVPLPFIAWPLIVISALTGAAFAFLPIQERPLDHWLAAFLKAIFKPTKLKYESKVLPAKDPLFKNRLNYFVATLQKPVAAPVVKDAFINPNQPLIPIQNPNLKAQAAPLAPKAPLPDLRSMSASSGTAPGAPKQIPLPPIDLKKSLAEENSGGTPSQVPEKDQLKRTVEVAKEAQGTQTKIANLEKQLSQIKSTAAQPGVNPKSYINQFEQVLGDLQKLNEQASSLSHELAELAQTSPQQQKAEIAQAKPIASVSLTTFPNVINGIVTDSKGSYVEGAIVVAHNKQGLPVRALKSNKLGQFIAATPLPNGIYTIGVEKEGLLFDSVQIELTGQILNPISISAKKAAPILA